MSINNLEQEAKESLEKFLKESHKLINNLVNEYSLFFIQGLDEQIKKTWKEFETDFEFKDSLNRIQVIDIKTLKALGLCGEQLKLKLLVVKKWKERFLSIKSKKILLKLLDAIDTILDSLITATGINEAFKEIKDILRNSIDED